MSSYYDEPNEPAGPLSNRNVTLIVLGIAAVVGILGCVGLFYFIRGNPGAGKGQTPQAFQITGLPTSTPSLTPLPSETKAATATLEGVGGGGDATETPDLTLTFAAMPSVRTANLDELRGLVQMKPSPDASFQTVLSAVSVPQGTTLLTSENSNAKVTTTEHSIIRVSSQTQVSLSTFSGTSANPVTGLTLDFGKVWTIVGGPLGTGSFTVTTPIGKAEILGSWMGVEHNSTEQLDIITCLEGKCRYSNDKGVQELKTGEELIVKAGDPLPDPQTMDAAQLADWAVTKVPEVITLTATATSTLTPTGTRTPTATNTPRNTPNAQQTSDTGATKTAIAATTTQSTGNLNGTQTQIAATSTALAGSNSQTQAANSANNTATANASNMTATVFFFNATATAFYNSTQNSFTATSFAFTATSFAATSRYQATAALLTGTAQSVNSTLVAGSATASSVFATATANSANATGTSAAATQTQNAIPFVNFDPSSYATAVPESAGQVTLTVRIANPVSQNVNLVANFSNGSATGAGALGGGGGQDFVNTPISFFIPSNSTTTTISVPIADDNAAEGNETFQVTLSCAGGGACNGGAILGPNVTSTITIVNSAAPSVSFSTSSINVNEGNSGTTDVTVTVNLSRPYANTTTASIQYSRFAGDTATPGACGAAGVDYNTLTPGTLTFSPTETSKTFTVTICGDTLYEPDETINLQLTNPVNAVLGIATSTITIKNDDPIPTLSFGAPSYTIGEPQDPPTTAVLNIPVNLSAAAGAQVTVNYATANGTARADWGDYQATSGTLTFAAGTTTANIAVTINADFIKEDPETFTVALSSPTNAALGSPSTTLVTINDDPTDAAPVVNLSAPFSVPPNSSTTIVVSLNTDSGQVVSVSYSIGSGSPSPACSANLAAAGVDFNAGTGLLTYNPGKPGETSKSFTLTTLGGVTAATGAKCVPITINPTNATAPTTVYAVWIQP